MARLPSLSAACFVLLITLGAMAVAVTSAAMATAREAAVEKCEKDLDELMGSCEGYLRFPAEPKVAPSTACCAVVRKVDACLCAMVTPEVEQYVCMDKAVYLAGYCNRPFLPGSYCGSYHIPGPVV